MPPGQARLMQVERVWLLDVLLRQAEFMQKSHASRAQGERENRAYLASQARTVQD